jgi:hypothetical protein
MIWLEQVWINKHLHYTFDFIQSIPSDIKKGHLPHICGFYKKIK